MGLINYILNRVERYSDKKSKKREGQLAIAKAARLEKEVLNLTSENKQKIQEVHDDYTKFLGIVTHDMRGPIGNIESFSGLYKDGDIEKEKYFEILSKSLNALGEIGGLLKLVGDDLPTLKKKSQTLEIAETFNEFYNENKIFLDKNNIKVNTNYREIQVNMPKSILNCIIANSAGDAFNYAISYIKFSMRSDKDHIIYELENDTDGKIKRRIHGEGNGKGRPFLKHLVEKTYQGKVESRQENGKYFSTIYLPKEHVQVAEPKS